MLKTLTSIGIDTTVRGSTTGTGFSLTNIFHKILKYCLNYTELVINRLYK